MSISTVILKESIRGLGKAGEVVKVKRGYCSFLINQKKVVRATAANLEDLNNKRALIEQDNINKKQKAESLAESLKGLYLVTVRSSSEDHKLFGSVTKKDVAKLLQDKGYDVDHRNIIFPEIIKYLGEYNINLELHVDVVVPITLFIAKSESEAQEMVKVYLQRQKKPDAVVSEQTSSSGSTNEENVDSSSTNGANSTDI